jgi:WD40 repeat protein
MPDIYNMSDVFISYSRKDSEFVKKLFEDIKDTGKEVWADFEDIPKAADWWEEIKAGINAADTFIFVISPDSVQSDICHQEIDHALAMNKRFLPILHREITEDADKAKIHGAVSSHNWIFFREGDDYQASFKTLIESIETDLEHNRTLTRLLVRAKEWLDNEKSSSYLLQGDDLQQADNWLSSSVNKVPSPTDLHAEYIKNSRNAEAGRQRRLLTLVSIGMVISLALAALAGFQTYQAFQAQEAAQKAQQQAETNEHRARSLALASSANQALANNNPDLALILAREAVQVNDTQQVVITALADAAYAPATHVRIETRNVVNSLVYAQNGTIFAAGFNDGNICLYDGENGSKITCLEHGEGQPAHDGSILWLHMNHNGTVLLSSGLDKRLVLWNITPNTLETYTIVKEITVDELSASALASDGSFAVFGTNSGTLAYWDFTDNEPDYFSFYGEPSAPSPITVISFNRGNSLILTGSDQGSMWTWDIESREFLMEFFNPDNENKITAVAFSPDNTIVVAGDYNSGISVWNYELGTLIRAYQGHDGTVTGLSFSENGRRLFSSSWDNSIVEWDVDSGRVVQQFYGHTGGINALSLTGSNLQMISGGFDSTIRIWYVRPIIQDHQIVTNGTRVHSVDWNRDYIVSTQDNGEVLIFENRSSRLLHRIEGDSPAISLQLHPEQAIFTVLYQNCQLGLYTLSGETTWKIQLPITEECRHVEFRPNTEDILVLANNRLLLVNPNGESKNIPYNPERSLSLRAAAFTPDGTQLLIGEVYNENMLHLIDVETGDVIRNYTGHTDGVLAIAFNRDGTRFVTGSFDRNVGLWDINQEHSLLLLEGHSERVTDIDFHPDQIHAISSSSDRTMRLWDLNTGFTVFTYRGHSERVVHAQFSEDGSLMITGSYDSSLIIWKFPQRLDELLTWIEHNRYLRELSCHEKQLYIDSEIACEN